MAKLEKDVPLRILLKNVPLNILVLIAVVFGPSIIVDYLHGPIPAKLSCTAKSICNSRTPLTTINT
jgi:hypothetical protein